MLPMMEDRHKEKKPVPSWKRITVSGDIKYSHTFGKYHLPFKSHRTKTKMLNIERQNKFPIKSSRMNHAMGTTDAVLMFHIHILFEGGGGVG